MKPNKKQYRKYKNRISNYRKAHGLYKRRIHIPVTNFSEDMKHLKKDMENIGEDMKNIFSDFPILEKKDISGNSSIKTTEITLSENANSNLDIDDAHLPKYQEKQESMLEYNNDYRGNSMVEYVKFLEKENKALKNKSNKTYKTFNIAMCVLLFVLLLIGLVFL